LRIAYCVLRIGALRPPRIAYCVLRIAYWRFEASAYCVLRIAYCVLRIGALRPQDASTHVRPQDRSYCAARNRYNLAPYFPCGAQRYTHSSAGLQAGLVQGPRRGPLYPPSLESICRGLETHVRPQDVQYAIRNTQYARHLKAGCVWAANTQYAIRNTLRPPKWYCVIRNIASQYADAQYAA
jgi:hypothetical protein